AAHHPGFEPRPGKEPGERFIKHVEAASIGAESGHHDATSVGGEAFPPHHLTASRDARGWMEVAGDLGRRSVRQRLMTQRDAGDGKRGTDNAANAQWQFRVVVAGDPEPFSALL